jgi:putative acetyltransferase
MRSDPAPRFADSKFPVIMRNVTIRPETAADAAAIAEENRLAFGREAEARLVDGLRRGGYARLSLVAEVGGEVVAHILFSRLPIVTTDGSVVEAVALAPMAVRPADQRNGIGTRLVEEGLRRCRDQGDEIVVVLGHPSFYSRLGFSAALAEPLAGPFKGPAWMATELVPGALDGVAGWIEYPEPFRGVRE